MIIDGDYARDGYARIGGLLAPQVCNAFLNQFLQFLETSGTTIESLTRASTLLPLNAPEVYGFHYPPMMALLWGLTPAIEGAVGTALMPTYSYMRFYREGDVCRVHGDRPSCEHSLSLTLDYSDGVPWPLDVGSEWLDQPTPRIEEDFGGEDYASVAMEPGDAVLYRGVNLRHGRVTPNANAWSAHLFLHWVERDGIYAEHAFDRNAALARSVNPKLPRRQPV